MLRSNFSTFVPSFFTHNNVSEITRRGESTFGFFDPFFPRNESSKKRNNLSSKLNDIPSQIFITLASDELLRGCFIGVLYLLENNSRYGGNVSQTSKSISPFILSWILIALRRWQDTEFEQRCFLLWFSFSFSLRERRFSDFIRRLLTRIPLTRMRFLRSAESD